MKNKNFFYRVNPESVLSELITINRDYWLQFFLDFFLDLRVDDPVNTKTEIAAQIIRESHNFRELRSKAGKASVQHKLNKGQHMFNICSTQVEPVAVAVAVTESKDKKLRTSGDVRMKEFDIFWNVCPARAKRCGVAAAKKSWRNHVNGNASEVIKSMEQHSGCKDWVKDDGQFIPMATTWLNQHRWTVEVEQEFNSMAGVK